MKRQYKNLKRFFTMVELLIVIAIIAILAGLLLPALKKAKDKAKDILCTNNHKQFGTATFMYASDYQDYYPASYMRDGTPAWFSHLGEYSKPYSQIRAPAGAGAGRHEHGNNMYFCPVNNVSCYWTAGTPPYHYTNYMANYYSGFQQADLTFIYRYKLSQIRKPEWVIYLYDARIPLSGDTIGSYYGPGTSNNADILSKSPFHHNGKGNFLTFDGHVDSAYPGQTGYSQSNFLYVYLPTAQ